MRPWIARALSSLAALTIVTALFASASLMVSAVMPLAGRLHLHGPKAGVVISVTSSMTTTGIVMWLVLVGRRRKARIEPDVVPLPRLPKAS